MTEQELYEYHEQTFKPIYADLVAILGSKPEQIAFELEATLSHIAVANTDSSLHDENIDKAHGHLQRASLDAVKIMWLEYRQRAEKIILDQDLRKFASKSSEQELLAKYQHAEQLAKNARKKELMNTGRNPSDSINLYYEAANSFSEVIELIDPEKVSSLDRFKFKYKRKEIAVSFIIGFISSTLVALLIP